MPATAAHLLLPANDAQATIRTASEQPTSQKTRQIFIWIQQLANTSLRQACAALRKRGLTGMHGLVLQTGFLYSMQTFCLASGPAPPARVPGKTSEGIRHVSSFRDGLICDLFCLSCVTKRC